MADSLIVTDLDFDTIKENLKTFLRSQSEFTDYDFEGSGLSVLLDILAYNTHYNAYYVNMIANEAFLDTALLRDSVISHAKVLGYLPYSRKAAKATINFTVNSDSTVPATCTIPRGFTFLSEPIDGVTYKFVAISDKRVTKTSSSNVFSFIDLPIYEGQFVTYNFVHNESSNPKQVYLLPDPNIDTTTIAVVVQPYSQNTETFTYTLSTDSSNTSTSSEVFYLQEGKNQLFEVYFGDNSIGKKLPNGAVVNISYLVTNGEDANKANNFVATDILSDSLGNSLTSFVIDPVSEAAGGKERESVESIKFSAPLTFTTQNRLVTFKDYETYIQKNYPAISSVSVWGGEEETPPTFGRVYVALKPKEGYYLSDTEKNRIIEEIIKPKAVVAVQTVIRDPEFVYLLLSNEVSYDAKKTTLTEEQLRNAIRNAIINYKTTYLDKFSGKFVTSRVQDAIDAVDRVAILGSKITVSVQKRFEPDLTGSFPYTVSFNVPLRRGTIGNKMVSTFFTVDDSSGVERQVQFDEVPQSFSGITSIEIINPGQQYTSVPTVTINGDGEGATAVARIVNGSIEGIDVTNRGIDYTRATVTITGGGGYGASATVVIDGRTGTIRTVYYDSRSQRQIVDENAGSIDYDNGIIKISNIAIKNVIADDGLIRLSMEVNKGILDTTKNTIMTIDENDPSSISTTLEAE